MRVGLCGGVGRQTGNAPPPLCYESYYSSYRGADENIETAGLYNTAGFNHDTRASSASSPSCHDVWRRGSCDGLAGLAVQRLLAEDEVTKMAHMCALVGQNAPMALVTQSGLKE
jgi:hypothetical protein